MNLFKFKYQENTAVAPTADKTDTAVLAIDDDTTADKSRDTEDKSADDRSRDDKSADDNSEPQTTVRKLDLKTDIGELNFYFCLFDFRKTFDGIILLL